MQLYVIRNCDSGQVLGVYPGSSEADAYCAMLFDAGALEQALSDFRAEALAAQDMRAVAVVDGGRYSVLESEPVDVDGPPSYFVHDEASEEVVCYCDSPKDADAEAARLNLIAACEVMLAGRQDLTVRPLRGMWAVVGLGDDADYGEVLDTDEEGAEVAWHGSETRARCPLDTLAQAWITPRKFDAQVRADAR